MLYLVFERAKQWARWVGMARAVITPQWNLSSPYYKKNVLERQRWATREELRLAIATWIEKTYHCCRRQRRLSRLTPIEFEAINMALQSA